MKEKWQPSTRLRDCPREYRDAVEAGYRLGLLRALSLVPRFSPGNDEIWAEYGKAFVLSGDIVADVPLSPDEYVEDYNLRVISKFEQLIGRRG